MLFSIATRTVVLDQFTYLTRYWYLTFPGPRGVKNEIVLNKVNFYLFPIIITNHNSHIGNLPKHVFISRGVSFWNLFLFV